jgi:hypothetical protein
VRELTPDELVAFLTKLDNLVSQAQELHLTLFIINELSWGSSVGRAPLLAERSAHQS